VTDVAVDETNSPSEDAGAQDAAASKPPRSRTVRVLWYVGVGLLAAFLLTCAVWTATGGRTYVVSTPSMSPKVPVGSLILVRPVPAGGPHVGQIIAFHPPDEPNVTYTHRVVKILPGPGYQTKGDLDSTPDAWVVSPKAIVGVATHHFKRVGFLVRALPWLALGAVILMAMSAFVPRNRRRIFSFIGGTIVVSIAILVVRPLVRGVFLYSGLVHGKIHAAVVNTGLLPLRFTMNGAVSQHAAGGYPAALVARPPAGGHVMINGNVDLSFFGWVVLVLICLAPLMIALAVPPKYWTGHDPDTDPLSTADTDPDTDPDVDVSPAGDAPAAAPA
jgi:signal peptidase I